MLNPSFPIFPESKEKESRKSKAELPPFADVLPRSRSRH